MDLEVDGDISLIDKSPMENIKKDAATLPTTIKHVSGPAMMGIQRGLPGGTLMPGGLPLASTASGGPGVCGGAAASDSAIAQPAHATVQVMPRSAQGDGARGQGGHQSAPEEHHAQINLLVRGRPGQSDDDLASQMQSNAVQASISRADAQ